jgi:hypothetical protein
VDMFVLSDIGFTIVLHKILEILYPAKLTVET